MYEIIPGILEKDWPAVERKLKLVRPFTKTIHVDLIDGKFVSNTTFSDPSRFLPFADTFFLELHMMVNEPIDYLEAWAKAGFRRFLGHIEKMSDQAAFIARGQELGEVGLALDGPTPISKITVSLRDLDCLMVYTSQQVGFSGPPFLDERLEKLREIHKRMSSLPIEVDGGITDVSLPKALSAGATRFVSTSFLFKTGDFEKQFNRLGSFLPA